ncbi:MAG: 3-hydroxyacyl-CoA dehydrogenase NAD-binding domain-containing protein, partial [Vulcanimicrobiaceae bacterium]
MTEIARVGVCGAGLMGSGIAQTAAAAGFEVVLMEVDAAALQRGTASMAAALDKAVAKQRMTQIERDAVF